MHAKTSTHLSKLELVSLLTVLNDTRRFPSHLTDVSSPTMMTSSH